MKPVITRIRIAVLSLVMLLLFTLKIQAFAPQNWHRNHHRTCELQVAIEPPTSSPSTTNDGQEVPQYNAQVDRFHSDMIRVLETRKKQRETSTAAATTTTPLNNIFERRQRPSVITDDYDGAERVLNMLQHMVEVGVATEETYQIAMDAVLSRGRLRWKDKKSNDHTIICSADQLETLLQQLEYRDVTISVDTYNKVLQAYAVCATPRGDRKYAKRADMLLEKMMELDVYNVDSLVHTLHAWSWQQANLQSDECAQRAHALLKQIQNNKLLQDDPSRLMQCYDWVLEAWSKCKSEGSPERATVIFKQMKKLNATMPSNSVGLPNAESYSNVILAWSKCTNNVDSAKRAQALLKEMVKQYQAGAFPEYSEPELIAFNGCISAWARMGRPDRAESILWYLDDISRSCTRLVPDVVTYNSVLHGLVKSHDKKQALDKAIDIVQHMEDHCEEQPAISPDSFTYNTLMKAWIQSGEPDAPEQAEAILSKIEKLSTRNDGFEMTNRHFNVVINAYSKSNDRMAASKAHRLLKRMEESNQIQPDIISYTSVMECYSKSSDPNASVMAEELLERAFEQYGRTKDKAVMPNLRTFTMAIQALAQCPRTGNALKARGLLTRLTELYDTTGNESLRPNEYPYNYVINCAANTIGTTKEKIQAFQMATKTYQEMRNSPLVKPDSFTYAFWIKACNNLLPQSSELHTKCVSVAFEQCKKDGLVTNEVLNRLQQGSSAEVIQKLLGAKFSKSSRTGNLQVHDLPSVWSCNTQRRTSKRRTR